MLSFQTFSSGEGGARYYTQDGGYYNDEAMRDSSEWFGKGAKEAGLTGPVDPDKFDELWQGKTPSGQIMHGRSGGDGTRRAALDMTFSASKTASIAALVFQDNRVKDAHEAAVRNTLSIVEKEFVQTRTVHNGEVTVHSDLNIISALFHHETSRKDDPQMHTHAVILNMVKMDSGGDVKYRALHNDEIIDRQRVLTQVYRTHFQNELSRQKIDYWVGQHGEIEVSGISKELAESFSKRARDINEAQERSDQDRTAAGLKELALKTRPAKKVDLDKEHLQRSWAAHAQDRFNENMQTYHDAQNQAKRDDEPRKSFVEKVKEFFSPLSAKTEEQISHNDPLGAAISHLFEKNSVATRDEILTTSMRFGQSDFEGAQRAINKQVLERNLVYVDSKQALLTTSAVLAEQVKIREIVSQDLNIHSQILPKSEADSFRKRLDRSGLTEQQRQLVKQPLLTESRYVLAQGVAGAGKTFALQTLTTELKRQEWDVIALAPSHAAVAQLSDLGDGVKRETLQNFLVRNKNNISRNSVQDLSRTAIYVDESSMISSPQMLQFVEQVKSLDVGKVVFLGDIKQHDSVERGSPFAMLQTQTKLPVVELKETFRQRDQEFKDAIHDLAAGRIGKALEFFKGKFVDASSLDSDRNTLAAEAFLKVPKDRRKDFAVVTASNADRVQINEFIRAGLQQEGSLANQGIMVRDLTPLSLSAAEASHPNSYRVGDVVIFTAANKSIGVSKNEQFTISRVDLHKGEVELSGSNNRTIELRPQEDKSPLQKAAVFQDGSKEIAIGETLKIKMYDKNDELKGGDIVRVLDISGDNVSVTRIADGSKHELDAQSTQIATSQYPYASTSHAVQGDTIPNIIGSLDPNSPLAHQKTFYVMASRASEDVQIFTQDPEKLEQKLSELTGERLDPENTMRQNLDGEEKENRRDEEKSATNEDSKDPDKQKDEERHKTDDSEKTKNVMSIQLEKTRQLER